ncbi:MAG: hypothetical protein HRT61_25060, partial [Ekhidna sp.]|nr:hypothetical protein [Ekhidna sp.]
MKNIACPQCREKGGDSTGNHMMVFEEGTGYCTKCPKAFTPTEVEAAEAGKRSPRASSNKYNASAGNGWQRPKDKTIEDIQFYGTIGDAKRGISVNADTHFGIRTETSTSTGAAIRRFYPYWDSEDIVGYKSRKLPKDFEKAVGT